MCVFKIQTNSITIRIELRENGEKRKKQQENKETVENAEKKTNMYKKKEIKRIKKTKTKTNMAFIDSYIQDLLLEVPKQILRNALHYEDVSKLSFFYNSLNHKAVRVLEDL